MSEEESEGRIGHNVQAVNECLQKGMRELLQLDREIAEVREKYLRPLQEAKTKLKQNLKGDTGLRLKVISAHYKLFQMQEDAKEFVEENECDKLLDEMRTMHRALGAGQMLDFIDVIDHVSNDEQADADELAAEEEDEAA